LTNSHQAIQWLGNLGPRTAAWLNDVGVSTREQREELGSRDAYLLVKSRVPQCSLNLLWALEGALTETEGRAILEDRERELLAGLSAKS